MNALKHPLTTEQVPFSVLWKALRCSDTRCSCRFEDHLAHCPAHAAIFPNLEVKETKDGKFTWKCLNGCSKSEIVSAVRRVIAASPHIVLNVASFDPAPSTEEPDVLTPYASDADALSPSGTQITEVDGPTETIDELHNDSNSASIIEPEFNETIDESLSPAIPASSYEEIYNLPYGVSFTSFEDSSRPSIQDIAMTLGLWEHSSSEEWHGANPFEEEGGATEDGFILFPKGNAHDRKLEKNYSRQEVDALAEQIERGATPTRSPIAPKVKANSQFFDWDAATIHRYYDEDMFLLYQVGRIDGAKGKDIRQRRPSRKVRFEKGHPNLPKSDWIYNMKEVRRIFYNLPTLLRAKRVFFCEGEKSANAFNDWLESQGKLGECMATTTVGGAKNVHLTEFHDILANKDVVILPDNDDLGRKYGEELRALCRATAKTVRVCELPDLPDKGDVCDYLENCEKSGRKPAELLELVGRTDWMPPTNTGNERNHTTQKLERTSEDIETGSIANSTALPSSAKTEVSQGDSALPKTPTGISLPPAPAPMTENLPIADASAVSLDDAPELVDHAKGQFPFRRLSDVNGWDEPEWLIDHYLTVGGTSMVTAKHASFKTFFCLDMALCVATGRSFHGIKVQRGNVVYIAAEGASGLKSRALAWSTHHEAALPDNFYVLDLPFELTETKVLDSFIREVDVLEPSLILLDTLARCAVGLDENSSRDMGIFSAAVIGLARATGAHILTIHHNSKKGDYRGSTALPAAVDTHLSLERKDDMVTLTMEKQREAKEFIP